MRWSAILGIAYVGCIVVLKILENRLVYHPLKAAESWYMFPEVEPRDVWLQATDGTKLHAWWIPPSRPGAGAVLLAHGNGGNLSHRVPFAIRLRETLGAGVLLFDYPGYGRSEGKPSEAGCYDAAEAAYHWLTATAKTPPDRVLILGESLGGGVAVQMAANHECRSLVLLFTFTTLPDAAKVHYRLLPVRFLMKNRFDNISKIHTIHRPVFIAHGTADRVIPFVQGERLFAAANDPKEFVRMEGGEHDIALPDVFFEKLAAFLTRTAP